MLTLVVILKNSFIGFIKLFRYGS